MCFSLGSNSTNWITMLMTTSTFEKVVYNADESNLRQENRNKLHRHIQHGNPSKYVLLVIITMN
ncbi:hypothetical protein PanWU01x14_159050 [Parasponia andersonii]|uniref:Uncharacterized protein n=1 Tax=Parasponia andersonii TaxID=3476 RepID=A0A2P5CEU5_PARAD|nr:hypothetical protein PanWU01x14_159050 [Parasponia andersonii]